MLLSVKTQELEKAPGPCRQHQDCSMTEKSWALLITQAEKKDIEMIENPQCQHYKNSYKRRKKSRG